MKVVKHVQLWESCGLIVSDKSSSIRYTNQTGGYACNHPTEWGAFIPIEDFPTERFHGYFCGEKYKGNCYTGIDEDDAMWVDEQMAMLDKPYDYLAREQEYWLKVDRTRLEISEEAWIHVILADGTRAVLTWPNSD